MSKKIIPIRGMHCRSCEIMIERELKKVEGVTSVVANQRQGTAEIEYSRHPSNHDIQAAVQRAGYEVGEKDKLPWISRNIADYKDLGIGALVVGLVVFLGFAYGLFDMSYAPSGTGLFAALLVGLVAGVSTCMALIGGLVLGLAARHAEMHPEATPAQKFRPHVLFNAGRVIGYAVFGGVIGLIGSVLQPSPFVLALMTIAVGLVMVFLGLKLVEIFPALRDRSLTLPPSIGKWLGLGKADQATYTSTRAFVTGALTFFLPCGFTQAMQLYAVSSGSFTQGALIMGLFALGTAPGLLSVAGLASVFKGRAARQFFMAAGIIVILLGTFNIVNASRLVTAGIGLDVESATEVTNQEPLVVEMTQKSSGYFPNSFTVEKGRPVKWVIIGTNPYACSGSIYMPKYGINQQLVKGENVITFTPTKTGTIKFSCSMGMYTGTFKVVEPGSAPSAANNKPGGDDTLAAAAVAPSVRGGCSMMGGGRAPVATGKAVPATDDAGVQVIKASYTNRGGMLPGSFTVAKGKPVRFELDAKENGYGCMGSIMIPGLVDQPRYIEKGAMVFEFTPQQAGSYDIACAMGVPHASLTVTS